MEKSLRITKTQTSKKLLFVLIDGLGDTHYNLKEIIGKKGNEDVTLQVEVNENLFKSPLEMAEKDASSALSTSGINENLFKSPLEMAENDAFSALANSGINGIHDPVAPGVPCGSDTAHLNLFGYPPEVYYKGRGAFETIGMGLEMLSGDIGLKCNFGYIDPSSNIVISRKMNSEYTPTAKKFCKILDGIVLSEYPELSISVLHSVDFRCVIRLSSKTLELSSMVLGTDPIFDGKPIVTSSPLEKTKSAETTARILNLLHQKIHSILVQNPESVKLRESGFKYANVVLFRGPSHNHQYPPFEKTHNLKSFMLADRGIIRGLGIALGIPNMAPNPPLSLHSIQVLNSLKKLSKNTDKILSSNISSFIQELKAAPIVDLYTVSFLEFIISHFHLTKKFNSFRSLVHLYKKILTSVELLSQEYNFGFLHIKEVDEASHAKNVEEKVYYLSVINFLIHIYIKKTYSKRIENFNNSEHYVIITGDHSTPCHYGDHSIEPVPILLGNLDIAYNIINKIFDPPTKKYSFFHRDHVTKFSETASVNGDLGRFLGKSMINLIKMVTN